VELLRNAGVEYSQMCILIFYKAQLRLYKGRAPDGLSVMSEDSAQGWDFDSVTLDTVVPGESRYVLGLVSDAKRKNVVRSRVRHRQIIVGDRSMSEFPHTSTSSELWVRLIRQHERKNALHSVTIREYLTMEDSDMPGSTFEGAPRRSEDT